MINHNSKKTGIQGYEIVRRQSSLIGARALSVLLAIWLGMAVFMPFAQASSCTQELPDDYVVGRTPGEVVTITSSTTFPGRLVIKNRSLLYIHDVMTDSVVLNGDVLICDSSIFKVERSVITVNMSYFLERQFRAENGSAVEFKDSFFINDNVLPTSIVLANSHLTMEFVNRRERRPDLANKVVGWTTTMADVSTKDPSNATISETIYNGEFTGFAGNSSLRFIRSAGLILWINVNEASTGGTLTPPHTQATAISWRFDRNTPGFSGAQYSIEIDRSTYIYSAVLIFIYNGALSHADLTIRDSETAIGLVFLNYTGVRLTNLRERSYDDFSPALPSRRLRLQRTKVWSWGIYAWSSSITATDSEIGEAYSEAILQTSSYVELQRSRLTGNGGQYRANNMNGSIPPARLKIVDCDIYSNPTAKNGGQVILQSSRMYEEGEGTASGAQLIADGGKVSVFNSVLSSGIESLALGTGVIAKASITPSIAIREDGTRVVTFRGDADIVSERPTFARYKIEYAPQSNPSARTQIHLAGASVINGTLYTWNVPQDIDGGNYLITLGVYDSSDGPAYETTQVLRLPDAGGVIPYALRGNGVEGLKTVRNKDEQRVGSISIDPDVATALAGTAILSFTQEGEVFTEATVPDATLTTRARVFVLANDTVSTILALANPGRVDTNVQLTLTREDGITPLGQARLSLPASGQIANPLNELIRSMPAQMQGCLRIESDQPVGIVALKRAQDAAGNPKFSTLPIADEDVLRTGQFALLPYITDGGGMKTQIILMNITEERLTGQIYFYSPDGTELPLLIGSGKSSQIAYDINPDGTLILTTAGQEGAVQSGIVWIVADRGQVPYASALISSTLNQSLTWEAGYSATPATRQARMFVERSESIKPGISIANPNADPVTVTLSLRIGDVITNRATIEIPPHGQMSGLLSEMLNIVVGTLRGVLDITSSAPVNIVGLRTRSNEQSLVMTVLPVIDTSALVQREHFLFPYMIDGEGFSTQIILINPNSSPISGSISIITPSSEIQPVEYISLF